MKSIEIYTWTTCPYCIRAKALLDAKGLTYKEWVIDGDTPALKALKEKTSSGTVPQIFIDGQFIGGCDDLHALEASGKLDRLLEG